MFSSRNNKQKYGNKYAGSRKSRVSFSYKDIDLRGFFEGALKENDNLDRDLEKPIYRFSLSPQ